MCHHHSYTGMDLRWWILKTFLGNLQTFQTIPMAGHWRRRGTTCGVPAQRNGYPGGHFICDGQRGFPPMGPWGPKGPFLLYSFPWLKRVRVLQRRGKVQVPLSYTVRRSEGTKKRGTSRDEREIKNLPQYIFIQNKTQKIIHLYIIKSL